MEEGVIIKWLNSEGDQVARGDELVEIETDKATMVYEADCSGVLEIKAEPGSVLEIGQLMAVISDEDQPRSPQAPPALAAEKEPPPENEAKEQEERVKASPLARAEAKKLNLELSKVEGSGPEGRIVHSDLPKEQAPGALPEAENPGGKGHTEITEPSRTQSLIARRMSESRATVPSFTVSISADMTSAWRLREELKEALIEGDKAPTVNDMVVKACALALSEQPQANGAWKDGRFEHYSRINIGVAVAGPGTLVVPTVFDADQKTLRQIAKESQMMAEQVRESTITPPQTSGGTFTVSNLGMFGIASFEAVINTPQAAILAVGAVQQQPTVKEGKLAVGMMMDMTLSCDHRILYGADAAKLLSRVKALLEAPLALA
jgi:pyruvate dehydrogenase E2 component (dihydrolipoamide acetyltransferase)